MCCLFKEDEINKLYIVVFDIMNGMGNNVGNIWFVFDCLCFVIKFSCVVL